MADTVGTKLLPPYVTFISLMNFVDSLKRGIPGQIDRSLMKTMSGSMQTQMMSALKYLHLVNTQGVVQDILTRLVNSEGAERTQVLHELLTASYPFLFSSFDLSKATSSQFRQKFTEVGATGDSVRKCIAFFLSAAKEANIEVSPYIAETVRQASENKPRKQATKPNTRSQRASSKSAADQEQVPSASNIVPWQQMLLAKFPSFDPAWPDEVKKEWFTAFHQMMKMGGPPSPSAASEEDTEDLDDGG